MGRGWERFVPLLTASRFLLLSEGRSCALLLCKLFVSDHWIIIITLTSQDKLWIVMEYLGGGSCADLLKSGPFKEDEIAIILRDTLKGFLKIWCYVSIWITVDLFILSDMWSHFSGFPFCSYSRFFLGLWSISLCRCQSLSSSSITSSSLFFPSLILSFWW